MILWTIFQTNKLNDKEINDKALHARGGMDRLYMSRNKEGRGLTRIEDCVEASIQGLEKYPKKMLKTMTNYSSQ